METKFIKAAVFIDGDKIYQLSEVLDNAEYLKWYNVGNIQYRPFIDDINMNGAHLEIDMTNRPVIFLRNIDPELSEKLKTAGYHIE